MYCIVLYLLNYLVLFIYLLTTCTELNIIINKKKTNRQNNMSPIAFNGQLSMRKISIGCDEGL